MNLRILLLTLFAMINGIVLYLFQLQLPFGQESLLLSLAYWGRLSSSSTVAAVLGLGTAIAGLVAAQRLDDLWKNRLVYLRWHDPHPARNAFLATRRQPFAQQELLSRFPAVKDAGFAPRAQIDAWQSVYGNYAQKQVVADTAKQWELMRGLYVIAVLFLLVFLFALLLKLPVPFQVLSSHIFVFGAQVIFLSLTARRVGYRLVDNLLGVALGVDDEDPAAGTGNGKRSGRNKRN